ncbi:uncharacterized protein LOC126741362 [Anthonomus grandis grandis]|uniref:uncharacterized protein LOC126741362 n=1 Tax=Anthonomus grandis grandis TaxID=2921223 RepID=UPI002166A8D7|nr:uncharacterized protein LOC126741362 [Anthonomus grandis grandis]
MRLPNLKELRTYQNIGKVLLDLPKPYVSKLKVIGDYDTSQSQMEAIIGVCPHLEELSLEDPEKKSLILLEELRHLKKLKISQVFPDNIRLRTLTLTTLQLNNSIVNSDDLCLTMENLILVSCQLRGFQESRFRNLRMLELIDCDVEKSQILPLLYYCDLIQRLALSNEINLTDKDLKDLCDKQKLKYLEELWLTLAKHLTIDSVILLMNHCDRLIELGTLNGWDVDNVEVNYLRCLVRLSNMKLNFLYFQCF